MSAQTIYAQLITAGLSPSGACGLMGNMQAESAMRANNAQDGMTRLSDDAYTAAADNGTIDFVRDAVGYGLCQWTYHTRKQALLSFAKSKGVSVGNEAMQVEFAVKELRNDYPGLFRYLCTTDDIHTAASRVCTEFERPAVNNIAVRANAAKQFYEQLYNSAPAKPSTAEKPKEAENTCTVTLPVLSHGSTGFAVWLAQILLHRHELPVKWTDGIFGNDTQTKIKLFQAKKKLDADGIIGAQTWAALLKGE